MSSSPRKNTARKSVGRGVWPGPPQVQTVRQVPRQENTPQAPASTPRRKQQNPGRRDNSQVAAHRQQEKRLRSGAPRELLPGREYLARSNFMIPKANFQRVVREILHENNDELRIQRGALEALQEAGEAHVINLMEKTQLCAIHAHRVTIMTKDMDLARRLSK